MGIDLSAIPADWKALPLHEAAEFTRKPRGLELPRSVRFVPMDLIPTTGIYASESEWRFTHELTSGTYVEGGDVMVAKITPCFENGKQGILAVDAPFAYATTEVIPLHGRGGLSDTLFLHFLLLHPGLRAKLTSQMEGSTNRQRLPKEVVEKAIVPTPPLGEQRKIAGVLSAVQRAIERQERLIALTAELKKTVMHKLFTEGTRGEPLKQTQIGAMPRSWEPTTLGSCCDIVGSSMSYTDFVRAPESTADTAVLCMAVKVSDMNLPGNEAAFTTANATKRLPVLTATKKLVPSNAVVFPKRGAAIATNKKRLTTTWTALDPNLIAVCTKEAVDPRFLFYWAQIFDLRKITDPGPTPQLNKKDLTPVALPLPSDLEEQQLVAAAVDAVEAKGVAQRAIHCCLSELFRTLLHQLMTAQIRVDDLDLSALDELNESAQPAGAA